jgi:hypothetical protein
MATKMMSSMRRFRLQCQTVKLMEMEMDCIKVRCCGGICVGKRIRREEISVLEENINQFRVLDKIRLGLLRAKSLQSCWPSDQNSSQFLASSQFSNTFLIPNHFNLLPLPCLTFKFTQNQLNNCSPQNLLKFAAKDIR